MYEAIQKILDKEEQIDYALSGEFARRIELWSNMYKDKAPWLSPTVQSLCLPASVAGEVARLTTLELQSHISGSSRATYLDKFYQRVCEQLRIQTEYAFAKGGMIFKPYPTAKGIAIQYIQADSFFPLEYDSEQITRCAFLDQFRKGQEIYSRIELHHIDGEEMSIRNRVFVSRTDGVLGTEVPIQSVSKWAQLAEEIRFEGVDKLPFGYFKVPLGNNKNSDSPLGVSVFSRADDLIREADERYSQINWEYKGKEAAVHIAQSLLKYRAETDSWEYPAGMQRLYRTVEYNSGAIDKPFMETYSPPIRDESFFNGLNNQLRKIEFNCNLAYGTLSDPNNTDKTAEETAEVTLDSFKDLLLPEVDTSLVIDQLTQQPQILAQTITESGTESVVRSIPEQSESASSEPDYEKVGEAVARALENTEVRLDGKKVGKVMTSRINAGLQEYAQMNQRGVM